MFGGDIKTHDVLFQPPAEVQGKIGMFKCRDEVISMALISVGLPLCNESPEDMQQVRELLEAQKPPVKTFSSNGG